MFDSRNVIAINSTRNSKPVNVNWYSVLIVAKFKVEQRANGRMDRMKLQTDLNRHCLANTVTSLFAGVHFITGKNLSKSITFLKLVDRKQLGR